MYFEKDIAKKVRDELKNINKNLKKRSIDETKGKMGKLGIWLNEKGMEVERMAEKDINHKDKFDDDNEFKEMLAKMNNVLSAMELSTKKDKTRKILEDNLKNMIEGSNIVVMNKCADIWGIFDEMQDELNATTIGLWNGQMNKGMISMDNEKGIWKGLRQKCKIKYWQLDFPKIN